MIEDRVERTALLNELEYHAARLTRLVALAQYDRVRRIYWMNELSITLAKIETCRSKIFYQAKSEVSHEALAREVS